MAYEFSGGDGSSGQDAFKRNDVSLNGAIPCKSSGGAQNFTVMGWINPTSSGTFEALISKQKAGPPSNIRGFLLARSGGNKADFEVAKDNTNNSTVVGTSDLLAGVWHHVAGTYDFITDGTSVMKIYVDGVLEATKTDAVGPPNANSIALHIARYLDLNTLDGKLEDMRIYERVLSAAEISTIFAARGSDSIVAGLLLRMPLLQDAPGVNASGDQIDLSNLDNDMEVTTATTAAVDGNLGFGRRA